MKNCVYRFLNKNNEIIYIGKAKDLKNRLNGHTHLPQVCYDERVAIEFISFDTEYEMDLAERYYIPKYKPKYNTVWSDRVINLSIEEFDNKKWINEKEYLEEQRKQFYFKLELEKEQRKLERYEKNKLKKEKQKLEKESAKKLREIKLNIQAYINKLEEENDIELNINIDDYDIYLDNYREFYDYIDDKKNGIVNEINCVNYNTRKVMCIGTGEIYENLIEYKNKLGLYDSLEDLRKVADNKEYILLGEYHPNHYGVFSVPMYLDRFERLDISIQENILKRIEQDKRSIICITDGKVYSNKYEASDTTNIYYGNIIKCCEHKANYVGTSDSKPLVWKWYDEYSNMTKEEIDKYMDKAYDVYNKRNKCKSKIN